MYEKERLVPHIQVLQQLWIIWQFYSVKWWVFIYYIYEFEFPNRWTMLCKSPFPVKHLLFTVLLSSPFLEYIIVNSMDFGRVSSQ